MDAGDLTKARVAAESVVDAAPRNAVARGVLGQVLSRSGNDADAAKQFEEAVSLDPTFGNGYALAVQYLKTKDTDRAGKVFVELIRGFGDTPEIRMQIGTAYASRLRGASDCGIRESTRQEQPISRRSLFVGCCVSIRAR